MEPETKLSNIKFNTQISGVIKNLFIVFMFMLPMIVFFLNYPMINKPIKDSYVPMTKITEPFSDVNIQAKSAYVFDVENKKMLYAKNEKDQLPLASLTKVMTALVAMENTNGLDKIKITSDSIRQEGDSGLKTEERWKLKDLINFSLITSSNDGIYAVASAIQGLLKLFVASESKNSSAIKLNSKETSESFLDLMNFKAHDISLNNTFYLNETGLDSSDSVNGGYGSAEDMAKLFAYIIKNNPIVLEATSYDQIEYISLDDIKHDAKNTNKIISSIPGLIASKTGYTDVSGGNLVVAFDPGLMRPIVISILGSTREGRFEDMQKLIKSAMEYLSNENNRN